MLWLRLGKLDFGHCRKPWFSVHGARAWFPAVTIANIGGVRLINLGFVVIEDNGFDVTHVAVAQFKRVSPAAVAQFKRVPVENFEKCRF